MSGLIKALEFVKQSERDEKEKNFIKAAFGYNRAVQHFVDALLCDPNLKDEIGDEIKFYLNRVEVNLLLQERKEQSKVLEPKNDIQIINRIESTILKTKPNIKFEDICGLETIKEDLMLAVVLPIQHPELYLEVEPYKGFLLFGPPGTGKTYIAHAVAGQSGCSNFFSISVADVISKYVGESEALIRNLFATARMRKPSIIFIDELDALAVRRSDSHDANSRSIKAELFVKMNDHLGSNHGVFIMATTSTPHHLDTAILRLLDKLIYVPLPEQQDRLKMFRKMISSGDFSEEQLNILAARTHGLSGSDIYKLCKRAKLMSLGRQLKTTFNSKPKSDNTTCDPQHETKLHYLDIPSGTLSLVQSRPTFENVLKCCTEIKPTVQSSEVEQFEEFVKKKREWYAHQQESTNSAPTPTWKEDIYQLFCS